MLCPLASIPSPLPVIKLSIEPLFSPTTVGEGDVDDEGEADCTVAYDSPKRGGNCLDCFCVYVEPRLKALRTLRIMLERDALLTRTRRVGRHAATTARPPSIMDQ